MPDPSGRSYRCRSPFIPASAPCFHSALADLRRQIPGLRATLRVRSVPDTDLVRLEGQGETELTDLAERLRRDYRIDFDAGPLAVLCVETIRKPAEGEGKYIRQTGGAATTVM